MTGETDDQLIDRAATEVDTTLLEWFASLSVVERLRDTSRNAAALERMARAASRNR